MRLFSCVHVAACAAVGLSGAMLATPTRADFAYSGFPYLGEVMFFTSPSYACPRGWALADGRLLKIREHNALFSLVGNIYGGNAEQLNGDGTFALPDLRGRIVRGVGHEPGLGPVYLGEKGGAASVRVETKNMPFIASTGAKLTPAPAGAAASATVAAGAVAKAPVADVPTLAPTFVVSPCIAIEGAYPEAAGN